jgi:hypothetical protein
LTGTTSILLLLLGLYLMLELLIIGEVLSETALVPGVLIGGLWGLSTRVYWG